MGKAGGIICRREYCGGSSPVYSHFFRLGGLARSQISARIGARQSNRRGNLSRGVFLYGLRRTTRRTKVSAHIWRLRLH